MNVIRVRATLRADGEVHDVDLHARAQPAGRSLARDRAQAVLRRSTTTTTSDARDRVEAIPGARGDEPETRVQSASSARNLHAALRRAAPTSSATRSCCSRKAACRSRRSPQLTGVGDGDGEEPPALCGREAAKLALEDSRCGTGLDDTMTDERDLAIRRSTQRWRAHSREMPPPRARCGDPRGRASRGGKRAGADRPAREATRPCSAGGCRSPRPRRSASSRSASLQLMPQDPTLDASVGSACRDGAESAAPAAPQRRLVSASARAGASRRAAERARRDAAPSRLRRSRRRRRRAARAQSPQPRRARAKSAPRQERDDSRPAVPLRRQQGRRRDIASREENVDAASGGRDPFPRAAIRCGVRDAQRVTCSQPVAAARKRRAAESSATASRRSRRQRSPPRRRCAASPAQSPASAARRRCADSCDERAAVASTKMRTPARDRPTRGSRASASCATTATRREAQRELTRISRRLMPDADAGFPRICGLRRPFRATRSAAVRREARATAAACGSAPAAPRAARRRGVSHERPGASAARRPRATRDPLRMHRQREVREAVRDRGERVARRRRRRRSAHAQPRARRRRARSSGRLHSPPQMPSGGTLLEQDLAAALDQQHAHGALRQRLRGPRRRQLRRCGARCARRNPRAPGHTSQRGRVRVQTRRAEVHQRLRVRLDVACRQQRFRDASTAAPRPSARRESLSIAAMAREHALDVAVEDRAALAERERGDRRRRRAADARQRGERRRIARKLAAVLDRRSRCAAACR